MQWLNLSREAAERAVELGPDLAVAHLAFARALLEQGARPEAAESYRRAADLDPLHPMPHVGLGMLFNAARDTTTPNGNSRGALRFGALAN